jgi:hypothetical protein
VKLYIFVVELLDPDTVDWIPLGKVLLPYDASEQQIAHAVAVFGVCAPRGNDNLVWGDFGVIYSDGGDAIVRLMPDEGKGVSLQR